MKSQIEPHVYEAAHNTAIVTDRSDLGLLKIRGQTRLDLIHRMSTQGVKNLKSGEGAATVLTTEIGRIIDRLTLYASSDTVYALTGEENADNIARYLMGYVFFNDDFHVENISDDTAIFAVYGPRAAQMLAENLGFPEVEIPLHHWREAEIAGVSAYLHRTEPIAGAGYYVMCTNEARDLIWQQLLDAGFVVADEPAFDFLRIASGLPRYGHELTGDYIPLEADLWSDVSFSKGCYIGQEIIARMESRGQLAKKLLRFALEHPVSDGTEIKADGKRAGTITSVGVGPEGARALGYLKTSILSEQAVLTADGAELQVLYEPEPEAT